MGLMDGLMTSTEAAKALRVLTDALAAEMPPQARAAGRYDQMVDAANRLPRPLLALGSVLLVAYAMIDPAGFAARMTALAGMPEALWWLIGGVITFTFGAREAHYMRNRPAPANAMPANAAPASAPAASAAPSTAAEPNAALEEWQQTRS